MWFVSVNKADLGLFLGHFERVIFSLRTGRADTESNVELLITSACFDWLYMPIGMFGV